MCCKGKPHDKGANELRHQLVCILGCNAGHVSVEPLEEAGHYLVRLGWEAMQICSQLGRTFTGTVDSILGHVEEHVAHHKELTRRKEEWKKGVAPPLMA